MKYAVWLCLCLQLTLLPAPLPAEDASARAPDGTSVWQIAQSHPSEIVRRTLQNEIASSYGNRAPLRYRLTKVSTTSNTTKEIVETSDGGVARLLEIDGKPLTASQQRDEIERLEKLDRDSSIQAHRRHSEDRDVERMRKFMRLLPDAFLYQFAGAAEQPDGTFIRLKFEPNPKFSPPDFETRILTGIRGEILIDPNDLRVKRIDGKTFRQVDFGWGIIGTLYPGAIMAIEQTKTQACGWQLTYLKLHMLGKELMFKSLHIEVEERAADYQRVPGNWSYHDAVRWLLQKNAITEFSDQPEPPALQLFGE